MVLDNHDHGKNRHNNQQWCQAIMTTRKHQHQQLAMALGNHDHEGNTNNNNSQRWCQVTTTLKQNKPQTQLSLNFFHKSQISQNKANDKRKKTLKLLSSFLSSERLIFYSLITKCDTH